LIGETSTRPPATRNDVADSLSSQAPKIALRYWLATLAGLAAALAFAFSAALADAAQLARPEVVVWGFRDGSTFRVPRGITIDAARDEVYVANTGAHRIEVFSLEGRPLERFVHRVPGPDGLPMDGEPHGLAIDQRGRLLVIDNLGPRSVDVLDRHGRAVARLDIPEGTPTAVTVLRDGRILVGTSGERSRIHEFTPDYAYRGAWGVPGSASGQLYDVTSLAETASGEVAVACARTELGIQLFTPAGVFIRGFGRHDIGAGNVSLPSGIAGTGDGRIWVSDELRQNVQVFDAEGTFLGAIGGSGLAPGCFNYPSALATDGDTVLAVTERESGRFQIFRISQSEEVTAGGTK
jgi:sugar lactone lactonase YvrE